jgi:hypothetical protein
VITQFDGLLIEFDDGRQPSPSVIGGGIAANGGMAIKKGQPIKTMHKSAGSGEAGGARR